VLVKEGVSSKRKRQRPVGQVRLVVSVMVSGGPLRCFIE